uniref:C3H1-type domain-containing protein n=2 Tax=Phaseolus vulgaris TaxID=3885 RepID=V7CNL5_PHAVU|nr:hypothetical protein PHAVU_002G186500g [Phaseolus vulgaris]ESW30835.1 hypothetical protein PHAVU_002G186500g [Phaseolus vulgaris]
MKHVIRNEGCNRNYQRFPYRKTSKTSAIKTGLRSSITCKYWINGNCMYGDQCRNLHSWSISEGTSIDVKEDNIIPSRLIWWTPPFEGFVKINCDGAFTMHGNKAGAGGVVRDWRGEFIFGFSSGLKNYSVLMAELEAIKIGIEIAISKGYKNLMVESDSKVAIDIITSLVVQQSNGDTSQSQNDMSSIIEISKTANKIHWNHVFREVNSAADGLAKHGLSLCPEEGVEVFEDPPYFIESHLYLDRAGKIYRR